MHVRHVTSPATAREISEAVGVTKKDAALVRKVLTELGYYKVSGSKLTRSTVADKASDGKKRAGASRPALAKAHG